MIGNAVGAEAAQLDAVATHQRSGDLSVDDVLRVTTVEVERVLVWPGLWLDLKSAVLDFIFVCAAPEVSNFDQTPTIP